MLRFVTCGTRCHTGRLRQVVWRLQKQNDRQEGLWEHLSRTEPKQSESTSLAGGNEDSSPLCVLRVWSWIKANAGRYSHVGPHFVLPVPHHVAGAQMNYVFFVQWVAERLASDPRSRLTRDCHSCRTPGRKEGFLARSEYTKIAGSVTLDLTTRLSIATQTILSRIPPNNSKLTYVWENYLFHYVSEGGFTFLVMADDSAGRLGRPYPSFRFRVTDLAIGGCHSHS